MSLSAPCSLHHLRPSLSFSARSLFLGRHRQPASQRYPLLPSLSLFISFSLSRWGANRDSQGLKSPPRPLCCRMKLAPPLMSSLQSRVVTCCCCVATVQFAHRRRPRVMSPSSFSFSPMGSLCRRCHCHGRRFANRKSQISLRCWSERSWLPPSPVTGIKLVGCLCQLLRGEPSGLRLIEPVSTSPLLQKSHLWVNP
ncbi:hypothetical protein RIF29_39588 [Crotalaria pallida]|uniref:Uncharacterized protein n=1 Tax=Crotalaria pallida TaxID=3830 RepID=A0AAN9E7T9_CROPI